MSGHVFLSYIREDKTLVDELQAVLEAAGFTVWRDTKDLWPGDNWEQKIRDAIRNGSLVFLACFSNALAGRDVSYQFAELMLAAEEYRLRPMDTSWLMTVRFEECVIPPVDLGGGRFLDRTIQRADLFGAHKTAQAARLVTAIHHVIDSTPEVPSPAVLEAVTMAKRAEGNGLDRVRDLLRNPSLVMDFDTYLTGLRRPVLEKLMDRSRFPMDRGPSRVEADVARAWVARVTDYETVVAELLEPMKLICAYGTPAHEPELSKTLRAVAKESAQRVGLDLYRHVHEYPALLLTYACSLSALSKRNFSMFRAATQDVLVNVDNGRAPFIAYSGAASVVGNWNFLGTLLCKQDEGVTIDDDLIGAVTEGRLGNRYTPVSDHLFTVLAPMFRDDFVTDEDYAEAFDQVEVLLDAIGADARATRKFYGGHGGYGRYTWRHRHAETTPEDQMLADLEKSDAGWSPLLGGLFEGDLDRAKTALGSVKENAAYLRKSRF